MGSPKAIHRIDRAFWDTSAIVPLCCRQDDSQVLRQIARRVRRVVAWWGTTIEAHSAFNRLVHEGTMSPQGLKQAVARLNIQRKAWIEVLPSDRVREIAETLPFNHGLRALDSLQLAAALVWCKEVPRGRIFVCCDERLIEAAEKAGFETLP